MDQMVVFSEIGCYESKWSILSTVVRILDFEPKTVHFMLKMSQISNQICCKNENSLKIPVDTNTIVNQRLPYQTWSHFSNFRDFLNEAR